MEKQKQQQKQALVSSLSQVVRNEKFKVVRAYITGHNRHCLLQDRACVIRSLS